MSERSIVIRLADLCEQLDLSREVCLELVELGLVEPEGNEPEEWEFDITMLSVVRRATRLQRDLHLDWSTVALLVSLLEERDQLRSELEILQQRLDRFLDT